MHRPSHFRVSVKPSLSFVLLCVIFCALWIAGGASRADALGQVVVRAVCWASIVTAILLGLRPSVANARAVYALLAATLCLVALQMVPLPPAIWGALPGRQIFLEAAAASGEAQPWRPWSIVPGATINAAASLIVPVAVLVFATGCNESDRARLPAILLCLILASTVIGQLQFLGVGFNNPFINEQIGQISGNFANRNHFALFLALGCLIAPAWAFIEGRGPDWRGPAALGMMLLFAMTILATGSRTGLLLGVLATGIGLALVREPIKKALRRAPRWAFPALMAGIIGVIAIFVLISVAANRAVSIDRALALDAGEDMRRRALPTLLAMVRIYFPAGSGFGGFDPVFRIHEPFELLELTYFNHAHNDFLEIALDAGAPGLLLLLAGLIWWGRASVRAWYAERGARQILPRLGSAMVLLVLIASIFDYPARTPMVMAMIIVAGVWLNSPIEGRRSPPALRKAGAHL